MNSVGACTLLLSVSTRVFGAITKTGNGIGRVSLLARRVQEGVLRRADCVCALWCLSRLGVAVTPGGGGGWVRGALAPSGELLGCGPRAGAGRGSSGHWLPGGLAGQGPGGPGGAPGEEGAALPQTCLCCCLPALLAAPSDVPPATCCLAFHVFAQKYPPSKGTLKYGNYNAVSLPNTLPVLQLTGSECWDSCQQMAYWALWTRLPGSARLTVVNIPWLDEENSMLLVSNPFCSSASHPLARLVNLFCEGKMASFLELLMCYRVDPKCQDCFHFYQDSCLSACFNSPSAEGSLSIDEDLSFWKTWIQISYQ